MYLLRYEGTPLFVSLADSCADNIYLCEIFTKVNIEEWTTVFVALVIKIIFVFISMFMIIDIFIVWSI